MSHAALTETIELVVAANSDKPYLVIDLADLAKRVGGILGHKEHPV